MAEEVIDYLGRDGGAELLSTVDPDGSRFGELEQKVVVSHTTLSNRIAEAREIGLLETDAVQTDRGSKPIHRLTPKGARVRYILEHTGAAQTYTLLQKYDKQVDNEVAEVKEELAEMGDDLENKSANYQYLSYLRGNPPELHRSDDMEDE